MEPSLRLFRALPVAAEWRGLPLPVDAMIAAETIPNGFVFSPLVSAQYDCAYMREINSYYARNPEQLNPTFPAWWSGVRSSPVEQLAIERIINHLREQPSGLFDWDTIFIPAKDLNVPELSLGIHLVVIRGLPQGELQGMMRDLAKRMRDAAHTLEDASLIYDYINPGAALWSAESLRHEASMVEGEYEDE